MTQTADITAEAEALIERLNALAADAESNGDHGVEEACDKAASTLRALLERNKALMRERTNLIETKREQIGRLNTRIAALERERDAWRKECEKLSTVWAENHSRNKRAEDAEARVKELEKALAAVKKMYAHEGAKALHELERAEAAEAALAEKDKALKLAEFMMTKDSLCKDERLEEGLAVIRRARNAGGNDDND